MNACKITLLFTGVISVYLVANSLWEVRHKENSVKDEQVDQAIKLLWSADHNERQIGKEILIHSGPKSVGPLLALLKEATESQSPLYDTNRREEGDEAWKQFRESFRQKDSQGIKNAADRITALREADIRTRLAIDATDLLIQLDVEDVYPLLLNRLLMDRNESGTKINWTPAMEALSAIGPPAVPRITRAIEEAPELAAAISIEGANRSKHGIKVDTEILQIRAAMVLGRIGNEQALPTLEKLSNTTDSEFLSRYVKNSIDEIKNKN